jgi:hypothetical protein
MSGERIGLASYGVALIFLAISLILPATQIIAWNEFPAVLLVFLGVWVMALAAIKLKYPHKYTRSPFSTFGYGMLTTTIGSLWFLNVRGMPLVYSVAAIVALLGALVIAAALKRS